MDSKKELRLPVVDFSGLSLALAGTPEWNTVRSKVTRALETHVSFEAVYDRVSSELRSAIFNDAIKDVFSLPVEIRSRSPGYLDRNTFEALESVIVEDVTPQGFESFTRLMWPQGNTHFRETAWSYAKLLNELDEMVQSMIMESLNIDKHYDRLIKNTYYTLRMSSYKVPSTDDEGDIVVFPEHTDPTLVTILGQDQVNGLEVLIKSGEWVRPAATTNSFIVTVGDLMEAFTNGLLQATRHRVVMKGGRNEARYSTIFSSATKQGYMVQAPEELVDESHPPVYKPFDFAEFYRFRYTEAALRAESALKLFCGVDLGD